MILSPFLKTAEIVQARASGGRVSVLIRASTPKRDRQNEAFLPEAWLYPDDRAYFLREGVIDYNHLSRLIPAKYRGASPAELAEAERLRLKAIMGEPKAIEVEGEDLLCQADLYRKNEYVEDLIPALEADTTRFGASVAGWTYPQSEKTKSLYGANVFDRARLDHIAICPLKEAINDETSITLLKSAMADIAGGISVPEAGINVRGEHLSGHFPELFRDFALSQPAFLDFLYGRLETELARTLDYEHAREFFLKCGLESPEARELATRAIIHFGSKQA